MTTAPIRWTLALALAATLPLTGCKALLASVTSPSDSISGSFEAIGGSLKAISTSSSGAGDASALDETYRRDLRAYAAAFVETGGTEEDFLRGISRIAEVHGITDWESQPGTLVAIGEGLRDVGLSEAQLQHTLEGVDPETAARVTEGWQRPSS